MTPSHTSLPRRIIHGCTEGFALISVTLIIVVLGMTVADVLRREISGKSVPGVVEWSEVAMVMIVFLGLGYAERQRAHVAMTLFVRMLPPRTAAIINSLGLFLVLLIVAWMVYVTADRALTSFEVKEFRFGLVRVPVWPARVALALGLLAYLLELLLRTADTVRAAADRRKPAVADSLSQTSTALL
ncbi:TRAP transporter small permease subunit [uncultured Aeromicrobium sp.]|uniref:TRAP transporter small permease subunit n=1 Tax=uncultured Aeromicrobium sp. TaxID=337820 RepID=UPI0025FD48E1|nr:TRAP transporter small permease [uncultured Aeromicrobium sp.]